MAFAFALPAIGSVALPALGSVVGGIGSLASAIPVVGGSLGSLIGTGGGGGLAGALTSLGTGGGLGASLGTLGTGIKGMLPALGHHSSGHLMGGLGDMFGGIYGTADKLLGGMLPNIGGAGVSPAEGYLGSLFPKAVGQNPMFGGQMVDAHGLPMSPINGGGGLFGGGFFGEGGGLDSIGGKVSGVAKVLQPFLGGGAGGTPPGVTQGTIGTRQVMPGETNKPIMFGGGQTPQNTPLQLGGPPTSYMNLPQPLQGQGPSYNNRLEEIESVVEQMMGEEGKVPMGKSPQQRSLEMMYGRPSSMVA